MIDLTMTKTKAVRKFKNTGEMLRSFGAPLRDIELVRCTANSFFVYLRGALVGEARRVESASVVVLTKKAA